MEATTVSTSRLQNLVVVSVDQLEKEELVDQGGGVVPVGLRHGAQQQRSVGGRHRRFAAVRQLLVIRHHLRDDQASNCQIDLIGSTVIHPWMPGLIGSSLLPRNTQQTPVSQY